jgi:hypothetical protein
MKKWRKQERKKLLMLWKERRMRNVRDWIKKNKTL